MVMCANQIVCTKYFGSEYKNNVFSVETRISGGKSLVTLDLEYGNYKFMCTFCAHFSLLRSNRPNFRRRPEEFGRDLLVHSLLLVVSAVDSVRERATAHNLIRASSRSFF